MKMHRLFLFRSLAFIHYFQARDLNNLLLCPRIFQVVLCPRIFKSRADSAAFKYSPMLF